MEGEDKVRSSSAFRRPAFRLLPADPQAPVRSLPHLVRYNALHNPEHLFLLQAVDNNVTTLSITFSHFAYVVQRCSEWLSTRLPPQPIAAAKPVPVAVLLESDVRSFAYLLALLWLDVPVDLANAATDSQFTILHIARLEEVYASAPPDVDVADAPDVDEDDRNVIILHSSGTTGLPKPIRLSHRYLLGYAGCHAFAPSDDCSGVNVSTLPLYHVCLLRMPCCLPSSSMLPTGRSTLMLCSQVAASSLMTVPSILEDMVADIDASGCPEKDFATLASLTFVAVGGGSMSEALGMKLHAQGVKLLNHYGATEIGALAPIFFPDQTYDWRYLRLRKDIGLDLRFTEALNGSEPEARRCRLVGYPFGWNTEFEIQDELECNPDQQLREVRILGRKDDLIVLATGEKVRPHPLEQAILQCPDVKTTVVFGNGRFELGVLVEPSSAASSTTSSAQLLETIWLYVLEGNRLMDGHAQVLSREAIIVTNGSRTIPRTDKGSVARKQAESMFETEIAEVYERLQRPELDDESGSFDSSQVQQYIRQLVRNCLPEHKQLRDWNDDTDIFELGIDSLQCIRLQRALEASLRRWRNPKHTGASLPRNFPYQYNTVASMAAAIRCPGDHVTAVLRQDLIRLQLQRFIDTSSGKPPDKAFGGNVVLMTGSTGSVGAHVLELLCHDARVDHITCLIRPRSSDGSNSHASKDEVISPLRARQEEANTRYHISLRDEDWSRIDFLEWTPGTEHLGLSSDRFEYLAQSITSILHCAWPMDFNRSVNSFAPHIHAVRCLAELAVLAQKYQSGAQPRLVVTSSIAAVGLYTSVAKSRTVPEMIIDDPLVTLPMGYAEAKWVCEHICAEFSRSHVGKIDPIVVRLGQITGSSKTGYWNPKEHLPAIFRAAQQIGQMPRLEGDVSWLPIDEAASILAEILLGPNRISGNAMILHVENPIRIPWADIVTEMSRHLGLLRDNSLPFLEWLDLAVRKAALGDHLDEFLKHHFTHMATGFVLDTTQARKVSPTLRSAGGLSSEVIGRYVQFWKSCAQRRFPQNASVLGVFQKHSLFTRLYHPVSIPVSTVLRRSLHMDSGEAPESDIATELLPILSNTTQSGLGSEPPPPPPPVPPRKPHEKSSIALKVRQAPPGWAFKGRVEDFKYDPLTPPVGLYFFYGTLQDPGILSEILDLPTPPVLRPAWIVGYRMRLWGQYAAVVNGAQTVVRGTAFEVTTEDHAAKIAIYETSNYWPAPCYISTIEGGEESQSDGYVFKFCGNSNDLSDGEFDLDQWLHLMRRKSKTEDTSEI
nr:non-canonical non-ribosomal peptide synthetase fub8 [Quercus suber]